MEESGIDSHMTTTIGHDFRYSHVREAAVVVGNFPKQRIKIVDVRSAIRARYGDHIDFIRYYGLSICTIRIEVNWYGMPLIGITNSNARFLFKIPWDGGIHVSCNQLKRRTLTDSPSYYGNER